MNLKVTTNACAEGWRFEDGWRCLVGRLGELVERVRAECRDVLTMFFGRKRGLL